MCEKKIRNFVVDFGVQPNFGAKMTITLCLPAQQYFISFIILEKNPDNDTL